MSLEAKIRKRDVKISELKTVNERLLKENSMIEQKLDDSLHHSSLLSLRRPQTAQVYKELVIPYTVFIHAYILAHHKISIT